MVHSCIVEGCKNRPNNPQLSWHRPVLQERSCLNMQEYVSQCMKNISKVCKPSHKRDEIMAKKKCTISFPVESFKQ